MGYGNSAPWTTNVICPYCNKMTEVELTEEDQNVIHGHDGLISCRRLDCEEEFKINVTVTVKQKAPK